MLVVASATAAPESVMAASNQTSRRSRPASTRTPSAIVRADSSHSNGTNAGYRMRRFRGKLNVQGQAPACMTRAPPAQK